MATISCQQNTFKTDGLSNGLLNEYGWMCILGLRKLSCQNMSWFHEKRWALEPSRV
jgi:hypothetical protein